MLSFAKNDRGIRLASAAVLFLPIVALICATCRSSVVELTLTLSWLAFAAIAFVCFLFGNAQNEESGQE